jgi:hypothetical protein
MDSLPEAATSTDATPATPRTVSGGRALAAFIVLAAILIGIVLLTRSNHQTVAPRDHGHSGTFSLSNAEAIARFKQLDRLRIRAYVQRDVTLVPLVAVPNSRAARSAIREIRRLRADSVIPRPNFRTKRLTVKAATATEIQIRQVLRYDLRFVDGHGNDVTARDRPQRQVILWTLRKSDSGDWLLSDGVITASRMIATK